MLTAATGSRDDPSYPRAVNEPRADSSARRDGATARTRDALVGSVLVLAAGTLATALTDQTASPIVVVVMGVAVAGEQLWHRRRQIPSHVPAALAAGDDVLTSGPTTTKVLIIAAAFVVFLLLNELLQGAAAVLLGFLAGHVVRDVVMAIRVARWQARHGHSLAWIHHDAQVEPRILL